MRRSRHTKTGFHELWFSGSGTLSQVLDERMVADALDSEEREAAAGRHGDIITGLGYAISWSAMFWVLLLAAIRFFSS